MPCLYYIAYEDVDFEDGQIMCRLNFFDNMQSALVFRQHIFNKQKKHIDCYYDGEINLIEYRTRIDLVDRLNELNNRKYNPSQKET